MKVGSFAVPITRYRDGRYYAALTLTPGAKPKKITSVDLDVVKDELERLLIQLVKGETEATQLSAREARIYIAARDALAGVNIEVDHAARLIVEAAGLVGGDPHRLIDAARFFAAANPQSNRAATIADVFAEFMRDKETALSNGDIGELRVNNLRKDLRSLVEQHGSTAIAVIRRQQLQDWLNNRTPRKGRTIGARRRRNLRDALICFFNFARDENYLPSGLQTEADKTTRPKVRRGRQPTFTAAELQLLLDYAAEHKVRVRLPLQKGQKQPEWILVDVLPYLAIQAFAGLRGSEIRRLRWEHAIRWEQKRLRLDQSDADKTGNARSVDMQPALMKWLDRYTAAHGFIVDPRIDRMDNVVRRIAQRVGLKWKQNVLRHSFGSYLTAVTYDLGYVSLQMGNDVRTCRGDYLDYKSKAEGEAYLNVMPAASRDDKIIDLPLSWRLAR